MSLHTAIPDVVAYQVEHADVSVNTIAALRALINKGVRHFMFDVQACKDKTIIVLHQITVKGDRGDVFVEYATLPELSNVDLGGGQRVLTLLDALQFLPEDADVSLRVVGRYTLYPLIEFLQEHSAYLPKKLWFVSGDQLLLHTLSNKFKQAKCAALLSGLPAHDLNVLLPHGIRAVIVSPQDINPYLVHELKDIGVELWVKGVNCCSVYRRCIDWDAKKVLSNQPGELKSKLHNCDRSDQLTH